MTSPEHDLHLESRDQVADDSSTTISLVDEQAHIAKRAVESDRVRVRTFTTVNEEVLTHPMVRHGLEIERRRVERQVGSAPPPVEEDGVTIISIVEERPVVSTALFVVEEVVIRHTVQSEEIQIPVSLRSMQAVVEQDSQRETSDRSE